METYDIIMLVILVGAMLFGAIKGFAWQLASIASITVSYVVAYRYREPFSQSIQADPPWNKFLAMLILYVGTSLLIWVAFRMISGTIDRLKLREFDRQVGAVFGLAKGMLYCILITLFAVTLAGDRVAETVFRSKSGRYIADVLNRSDSVIPPEIHEVVHPYLEKFDRRFEESEQDGAFPATPWLAGPNAASSTTTNANQPQNNLSGRSPWSGSLPSSQPTTTWPTQPFDRSQQMQQPTQRAQQPIWDGRRQR